MRSKEYEAIYALGQLLTYAFLLVHTLIPLFDVLRIHLHCNIHFKPKVHFQLKNLFKPRLTMHDIITREET
jgi:hypothetical protein